MPSECADRLASRQADVGIVPCVEFARQGLELLPGAGIACRGPVRSILLVSRKPFNQIETLAADTSSRTSVELARVVLERRYGARPKLIPNPPDLDRMLAGADAALIIGDPALRLEAPHPSLDLGAEWVEMTGLPMVFAVWAQRPGTPSVADAFVESCRYGRARLAEIARLEAPARGLSEQQALDYLEHNIVNELGPLEYQGMDLFLRYSGVK